MTVGDGHSPRSTVREDLHRRPRPPRSYRAAGGWVPTAGIYAGRYGARPSMSPTNSGSRSWPRIWRIARISPVWNQ